MMGKGVKPLALWNWNIVERGSKVSGGGSGQPKGENSRSG